MKSKLLVAIGIAVSAVLLWLALRGTDFRSIADSLSVANPAWAAPFLIFLFGFYWLKSMRWRDLLPSAENASAGGLFPIVMIGYAGTAVLPMQLGELIRTYIAAKKYALPYSLSLSSVVIERLFDLMTILFLLAAVSLAGQSTPEVMVSAGYLIGAATAVGITLSFLLATYADRFVAITLRLTTFLSERLRDAVVDQLRAAAAGLATIRSPGLVARVAVNSLVQWSLMGLCIWISLIALDVAVPPSGVVLVLVATIIGVSLPTSPGYVGNIQFAFVIALQPFGVSAAAAVAASIFYHVLAYASVVLVGFFFLHRLGLDMRTVESAARESVDSPQG